MGAAQAAGQLDHRPSAVLRQMLLLLLLEEALKSLAEPVVASTGCRAVCANWGLRCSADDNDMNATRAIRRIKPATS